MRTLGEIIAWRARFCGKSPAVRHKDRRLAYAELDRRVSRVANLLIARGVRPGDRVAVFDRANDRVVETILGIARAGAVYVPYNWRLSAPEIAQFAEDCPPRLLFVGDEWLPVWQNAVGGSPDIPVIRFADEDYGRLVDMASESDPSRQVSETDIAWQIYTSGTTGRPKGVMLSHANIFASITGGVADYGRAGEARALACMPLFHVGGAGYLVASLFAGAEVLISVDADPERLADTIHSLAVTHALFVPTMLGQILNHATTRALNLQSLQTVLYGGSPIPEALLRESQRLFGCAFVQGYGLTETSGLVSQLSADDHARGGTRLKSCGLPALGMDVQIADMDGRPCQTGMAGEICVRGPTVMAGYWGNGPATADAFRDGYFRTGDAGMLDDRGYLWIHDRVKDMIVSGGENIYSIEVEAALRTHPDVVDVAVVGVPDDVWGEAVKAFVVLTEGAPERPGDLIEHCRRQIASYKRPRAIEFLQSLPRNATGKVLKAALRERGRH